MVSMPSKRKSKSGDRPTDAKRPTKPAESTAIIEPKPVTEPVTKPIQPSNIEIQKTAAIRLRSYRFQDALRRSDRKAALSDDFRTAELDNSRCWLHGYSNPMYLWSAMTVPADKPTASEVSDSKDIFDMLIGTGAKAMINGINPEDGRRPIDASNPPQRYVLVHYGIPHGLDINPTETNSPLYYFVEHNAGPSFIEIVVAAMLPESLDWSDPVANRTTFHLALSRSTDDSRGVAEILVRFAAVGAVDPYHACFDAKPIPTDDLPAMSILGIARSLYDEFESVHRPARIAEAVPVLLPPLVDLVRGYAMHV